MHMTVVRFFFQDKYQRADLTYYDENKWNRNFERVNQRWSLLKYRKFDQVDKCDLMIIRQVIKINIQHYVHRYAKDPETEVFNFFFD